MRKKNKISSAFGVAFIFIVQFISGVICGKYFLNVFLHLTSSTGFFSAKMQNLLADNNAFKIFSAILIVCIWMIAVYTAFLFQLLIHEMGHLVFGLLTGYRFLSFRFLNCVITKDREKLKLKKYSVVGTGGQCLMIPPEYKDEKIPFFLYNIGGALMNIISAVVFALLYFVFDNLFIKCVSFVVLICGIVNALINGLPIRTGDIDNDGKNIIQINKSKEAMRSYWNQLKISEFNHRGVRMKDIPDEFLKIGSKECLDNSMNAAIAVFKCDKLLDEHSFSDAETAIIDLLEYDCGIAGAYKNLLKCNLLFIKLISNDTYENIELLIDKKMKNILKKPSSNLSILRTQYAYALLFEHNIKKANEIKMCFEKIAESYLYEGEIQSETELIDIANSKSIAV